MRLGYHFTAAENLESILQRGLLPRPSPPHLADWIREDYGVDEIIWVFDRYPSGGPDLAFAGQIMFTAMSHQTTEVVCLEVRYFERHAARQIIAPYDRQVFHDGTLGPVNDKPRFSYHRQAPAHLLTRRVPPARLRLVGYWDLGWYARSGTLPPATRPKESR